ncbi:MAG: DNA gyrase subunit A [Dysosmobacter sp.]
MLIAGTPQGAGRAADPGGVDCLAHRVRAAAGSTSCWSKKQEKLHLLKGLKRILLDIDKAIRIIRETEEEAEVIPNLMIGFGIDQIQAEYVAEIKLRNINKEYILKRTQETGRPAGRDRRPGGHF